MEHIQPIAKLINSFRALPSVGQKVATRYAYAVVEMSDEELNEFVDTIMDAKSKTKHCSVCGGYSESEICDICSSRDRSCLCVVAHPKDILNIERMGATCVYFCLGGVLNPSRGVTTRDLRFDDLLERIIRDGVKEVIIATNTDVGGEATALYLAKILKDKGVIVTRPGIGLSIGTDLEYTDEVTLSRAFENRIRI